MEDISLYQKWSADEYLQMFPDFFHTSTIAYDSRCTLALPAYIYSSGIVYTGIPDKLYELVIRQTSHPWLSAINYMADTYMIVFAIIVFAAILTLYMTNKSFVKQSQLEETRRDFTNAIAHELKTPLGIIRGFAENIKEKTNIEKQDYYLEQVVKQTENMDLMVKEMIYISILTTYL